MRKACYAVQMREIDRCATEIGGIPSIVLMENAAAASVDVLKKKFGTLCGRRAAIFCGKGNNGGDGFCVARHLLNLGVEVKVFLVCGTSFSRDAEINYNIISKMNAEIIELCDVPDDYIASCDIVIDAIYGTGIRGVIDGLAYDVIHGINKFSKYTLSLDIPSGVNADTGEVCAIAVKADTTVTFAEYKIGMFLYDGADYMGDIVRADISIPQYIVDRQKITVNITDDDFVRENFPKRRDNSHKGDYGKVFIVGGSTGMTGAVYMASQAALNMGSGLITLGIPKSLNNIMENKLTEVMTLPLDDFDGGLTVGACGKIIEKMNSCDVILFGCGIGRSPEIKEVLRRVLKEAEVPVVIDADGLFALDTDMIADCSADVVLTPHNAEFARLSGGEIPLEKDRLTVGREFAEKYGITLILKGHHTLVTAADGVQYINITGNNGMATGGSGDVLAGMTASLIARGVSADKASVLAVYLHGRAGDIARDALGENSVTPTAVIDSIPKAIKGIL